MSEPEDTAEATVEAAEPTDPRLEATRERLLDRIDKLVAESKDLNELARVLFMLDLPKHMHRLLDEVADGLGKGLGETMGGFLAQKFGEHIRPIEEPWGGGAFDDTFTVQIEGRLDILPGGLARVEAEVETHVDQDESIPGLPAIVDVMLADLYDAIENGELPLQPMLASDLEGDHFGVQVYGAVEGDELHPRMCMFHTGTEWPMDKIMIAVRGLSEFHMRKMEGGEPSEQAPDAPEA